MSKKARIFWIIALLYVLASANVGIFNLISPIVMGEIGAVLLVVAFFFVLKRK